MPFVKRDESGAVIALYRERAPEAEEYLPPEHADVRAFVSAEEAPRDAEVAFFRSDQSMIRVFEDVVDVLVDKQKVLLTDLPAPAQTKLLNRKRLRSELTKIGDIISDESDGIL